MENTKLESLRFEKERLKKIIETKKEIKLKRNEEKVLLKEINQLNGQLSKSIPSRSIRNAGRFILFLKSEGTRSTLRSIWADIKAVFVGLQKFCHNVVHGGWEV